MGTFSGGPLRTWNLSRSGWSGVFWGERQENHFCTVLKLHAADFLACLSFMLLLCVLHLILAKRLRSSVLCVLTLLCLIPSHGHQLADLDPLELGFSVASCARVVWCGLGGGGRAVCLLYENRKTFCCCRAA